MNERERMICACVKKFREKVNWSQRDFGAQLGISLNQLASIEYGRTPLRYDIAWKIKTLFRVNLEWLSVGEFFPDSQFQNDLPPPDSTGLSEVALLSEVSDMVNGSKPSINYSAKRPEEIRLDKEEMHRRAIIAFRLRPLINSWIAKAPDGSVSDFEDKLLKFSKAYFGGLPTESDAIVRARLDALDWDQMRRELRARLPAGSVRQNHGTNKSEVAIDKWCPTKDNAGVKRIRSLSELLEALRVRLDKRGKKSALALALGVSRQAVNQWLSGNAKPSAEITFKLLNWIEQPERQNKAPHETESKH